MSDRQPYPLHDLCLIFPLPPADQYEALKQDIVRSGKVNRPVILFEGKVLDGRCRQQIAFEADIELSYEEFLGDYAAARSFVISENYARRHLTETQQAFIAAMIPTRKHGETTKPGTEQLPTLAEVAEQTGVPAPKIRAARKASKAAPIVQEAVASGTVTLEEAAAVADHPPEVQEAAVEAVALGQAETVVEAAEKIAPPVGEPAKKKLGRPKRTDPPRPKKSGSEVYSWKELEKHLGPVMRAPDEIATAYHLPTAFGGVAKTAEKAVKGLEEALVKAKAPPLLKLMYASDLLAKWLEEVRADILSGKTESSNGRKRKTATV